MTRLHEKSWTGSHDRTRFGSGPWDNEPDKVSWTDAETGRPCLAVRGPMGAWCGYVAVDPDHPLYKVGYSSCTVEGCTEDWCYEHSPEGRFEVHGGLTFSNLCRPGEDESTGICHVPQPGQPEHVWWFGFDCAHSGDKLPRDTYMTFADDEYRDLAYVQAECERLARQLVGAA